MALGEDYRFMSLRECYLNAEPDVDQQASETSVNLIIVMRLELSLRAAAADLVRESERNLGQTSLDDSIKSNLRTDACVVAIGRSCCITMASPFFSRTIRSSVLHLPPQLRSYVYKHQAKRSFSFTPSRKATLVDMAVAGPTALLDGIHSLGVPWHISLPLTAILVRSTLVYYLSTLPSRRSAAIQSNLIPLASARSHPGKFSESERARLRNAEHKDVNATVQKLVFSYTRYMHWFRSMRRLNKMFGARSAGPFRLLNFGMLITFTEAIRLKCGTRQGLLSLALSPFEATGRIIAPSQFPAAPELEARSAAEVLDARLEAANEAKNSPGQDTEAFDGPEIQSQDEMTRALTEHLQPLNGPDTISPHFDSTLQTEGPSWFTDLTVPDLTMTLPLTLSLTIAATILLRPTPNAQPRTRRPPALSTESPHSTPSSKPSALYSIRNRLEHLTFTQRLGLLVAYLFFFAALKMPVAILLYLIPSLITGWAQSRWLDVQRPIPPAIRACARPMRMKTAKEWSEF